MPPPPRRFGMVPFIPPPPSCIVRAIQEAGSSTRKLIGLALADRSTGAMTPSTRQCSGAVSLDAFHRGALSLTADTGSLMDDVAIVVPMTAVAQSISEIVFPIMISGA